MKEKEVSAERSSVRYSGSASVSVLRVSTVWNRAGNGQRAVVHSKPRFTVECVTRVHELREEQFRKKKPKITHRQDAITKARLPRNTSPLTARLAPHASLVFRIAWNTA
ncbi:hypothetical protein E2986_11691 [Frieseomelitta varia]|uniref:Uncharacterized protein n=1 Tax=Frieseomelitta varia TaxID=561572 RepID=A0A833VQ60_9HYME|nr:hypothetical protein E2986_11691 [Frieseomelitta varia]